MTTGQTMGGTGTEMISAFNLFKATEIIPDRKVLIDAFSSLFEVTELMNVELLIEEEPIEVDFKTKPVEGGNTESNPNTSTPRNKANKVEPKKATK